MGFKSRYVTCLPKDSLKIDNDCHVINMVYLNSLNKWVWMDPEFNAYVIDEKGTPLSIEEVRQRLIDDKPLELNKDANWNNKAPVVKEKYLYNYMAKNLYMLECPAISCYDTETYYKDASPKVVNYIKLIPLDLGSKPEKEGNCFYTQNPTFFWAKP
jgi:hypothetical protein